MIHRLLLATAVAACGLVATQALAGSPYYGANGAPTTSASSAPSSGGNEDYRALAPEGAASPSASVERRSQTAAGPTVVLGPDGYPPAQQDSVAFRHASGTMGAP